MSGWNPDVNGYAMLSAVEYGKLVAEAQRCFEFAMRAEGGQNGSVAIDSAIRAHTKAIQQLKTIRFVLEGGAQ